MSWTIDSGMYYDAGKKCHLLADDISLALGPLNSTLQNECGGMAGDHEKCTDWTTAYDRHAADIVTLTATLANALRRYGDVLEACGYNWWHSNRATASGPEPARPSASEPLYDSGMALPVTAIGDNGAGLDEGAVVGLLEKVGKIPNGDATKLVKARDAWKAFADSGYITGAADRVKGVNAKFTGSTDPNILDIEEKLNTLEQAAKLVAEAAKGMVTPVSEHHTALTDMRTEIQSAVAQAGVEIAAAIGITIAVVAVTLFTLPQTMRRTSLRAAVVPRRPGRQTPRRSRSFLNRPPGPAIPNRIVNWIPTRRFGNCTIRSLERVSRWMSVPTQAVVPVCRTEQRFVSETPVIREASPSMSSIPEAASQ